MFQDEPPPPEEFRDPPGPIDNPLYHVYETVKQSVTSPKQNKTAPCSPQRSRYCKQDGSYGGVSGSRQSVCTDCCQEAKDKFKDADEIDSENFSKFKENFRRQICFTGKIYRSGKF